MSPEILSGTGIEKEFKKALENRELSVWYQPQVDMRTGEIRGAEALVRWQKKNGAMISLDLFVPAWEKMGLIPLLDEEVDRLRGYPGHETPGNQLLSCVGQSVQNVCRTAGDHGRVPGHHRRIRDWERGTFL